MKNSNGVKKVDQALSRHRDTKTVYVYQIVKEAAKERLEYAARGINR